MERIELTPEQQEMLDGQEEGLQRMVDPRTHVSYVLVPESEYEAIRDILEDERLEQAIHEMALRNAANRLDEIP